MKCKLFMALAMLLWTLSVASATERDADGLTPLHLAAGHGDIAAVKSLIEKGADLFSLDSKMAVSVLHKAVYSGNAEVVEFLLEHGAPIDLQSPSNGDTPLHDAIYFKGGSGLRVIQVLLRHNPNLAIKNRAGLTPIESAKVLKDDSVASELEKYARSKHTEVGRALMAAVRANDLKKVSHLVSNPGIHVDEPDDQGFTPLIWAAREGFSDIVKLLLKKGANPNQEDQWMHANAAHKAAFWGRPDVMKLLAASGMDLNARGGYNGYTPLHDAIAQGHVEVVKVLLDAGVRTDIQGHDGKTALDLAKANGNGAVLKLLEQNVRH